MDNEDGHDLRTASRKQLANLLRELLKEASPQEDKPDRTQSKSELNEGADNQRPGEKDASSSSS